MLSTFRRQAAVLAAYLAQFGTTGIDSPNSRDAGSTALTQREKEQYQRDYRHAADLATASEITDDDIAALAQMRSRHGFPT
ncbi:hypothetical protein [Rhodococcus qingshengii]|uniref:hypothetical protein n=1 Tax=Rhodococcus qingshengii TaxID=334542 RepID=UPI001BEA8E60|nr:hypothetical protein [Rhodococcus qingshengii]MBT2274157.1 hypothetical protein [Rhodococcus qingshengii]